MQSDYAKFMQGDYAKFMHHDYAKFIQEDYAKSKYSKSEKNEKLQGNVNILHFFLGILKVVVGCRSRCTGYEAEVDTKSCQSWQTERRSQQTVGRSRQPQRPAQAREGQNCMYINGGVDCDWWSLHSHTAARNRTVVCLHTDTTVSNRVRKREREG